MFDDVGGVHAPPTDAAMAGGVEVPREATIHLDALLDALPGTIVYRLAMEPDGMRRLLYVSDSIRSLTGLTREAVLDDVGLWYALVDDEQVDRIAAAEAEAVRSMSRFRETVRYRIDGATRWFEIASQPTLLDDGTVLWDGTATDVTALLAERDERDRLATIVRETDDLVGIARASDGAAIFVNDAWRDMLGMKPDADPGTVSISSSHPERLMPYYRDVVLPTAARHGRWSGESLILDGEGRERPVSQVVIAHPERDPGEDVPVEYYSTIIRDLSGRVGLEGQLREASEQAEIALREVNHRVKNLFALVPALVQLSARGTTDVGELVHAVRDRVAALGRAHALTLNAFSEDRGVVLDALIRAVLEPYEDRADAFSIAGPAVRLSSRNGNAMSLALHEIATNAAKYGALSAERGRVAISWSIERSPDSSKGRLAFRWAEAGGPLVRAPEGLGGFGTTLIDRLIRAQEGTIEREWRPRGVVIEITLPLHERSQPVDSDNSTSQPKAGYIASEPGADMESAR